EFFFGAMRAGAIPLPLNTRAAAATLAHIITEAHCALAVVDPSSHREALTIARNPALRQRLSLGQRAEGFLSFEEEMAKPAAPVDPPVIADDAQAFQPYTSGSTGRPKGAIMTHHGMLWYVAYNQRYWPCAESDRGLVALPLFHKNALRGTVKPMLYAGGSFVLMPAYEPRAYLDALAKYRCTYSRGVAAVFTMFLEHRDYLRTLDLSALRELTIGSAVVTPELMEAVEHALPHVKVSESYGLTEGGSPLRAPIDGRAVPRGSPGIPAPEIELRLVDAEGNDAEEGELWIDPPMCAAAITTSRRLRVPSSPMDGCIPAIFSARTRMDSSISAAASTTCSVAAERTSTRKKSRTCCSAIPRWSMRWWRRCRIRSRAWCRPPW
ncbi:MAG TPA: class I adenylate-forming enzyme family protein, partial [Xanthobacteraceae bacterium]|nr:class I adenylate-forming enzyme family protein [Xanthobacteraceae bacterium]